MAYGDMADAVSGEVASAAEYNNMRDHVDDLDTRLDLVQGQVGAAPTSPNLNTRVATLEASSGALGAPVAQYASGFASTASGTPVALSGDPGVVFVAPSTGRIIITGGGRSDTNNGLVMAEVKTGSTIGSGTTFLAADTARSGDKGAREWLVTGLTPGNTYNARLMYASASGTSGFAQRYIIVKPSS